MSEHETETGLSDVEALEMAAQDAAQQANRCQERGLEKAQKHYTAVRSRKPPLLSVGMNLSVKKEQHDRSV